MLLLQSLWKPSESSQYSVSQHSRKVLPFSSACGIVVFNLVPWNAVEASPSSVSG